MADGTKIEWTDATANVVNGCSVLSPGCTNCYAMRLAGTRLKHHPTREGLTIDTKAGPVWNGTTRFHEPALQQVLRWQRGRMIFWNAHGDMFHDSVPDEWIDRCFAVMALTPQHKHQVLTKRSARMRAYFERIANDQHGDWLAHILEAMDAIDPDAGDGCCGSNAFGHWPLRNVWLGVSVEDQTRADERIPDLLATPAAVRWLSCEPLLAPVDISQWLGAVHHHPDNDQSNPAVQAIVHAARRHLGPTIDWVVAGSESGPNARPCQLDWVRTLRDQCQSANVAFFWKQHVEHGRKIKTPELDGKSWMEYPQISA